MCALLYSSSLRKKLDNFFLQMSKCFGRIQLVISEGCFGGVIIDRYVETWVINRYIPCWVFLNDGKW